MQPPSGRLGQSSCKCDIAQGSPQALLDLPACTHPHDAYHLHGNPHGRQARAVPTTILGLLISPKWERMRKRLFIYAIT